MTTKKTTRKPTMKPEEPTAESKTVEVHELSLTAYELMHLRDLFGILLPPAAETTVSQALAAVESRMLVEARLWAKVKVACDAMSIPTGSAAPDYVIAPSGPPPLSVFQLADRPGMMPEHEEEKSDEEEPVAAARGSLFKVSKQ